MLSETTLPNVAKVTPPPSPAGPSPVLVGAGKQQSQGREGVTELGPGTPGFQALAACPNKPPAPFHPLPRVKQVYLDGGKNRNSCPRIVTLSFTYTQHFPFMEDRRNPFMYILYIFIWASQGSAGVSEPPC